LSQSIITGSKKTQRQRNISRENDIFSQLDNLKFEAVWLDTFNRLEIRVFNSNASATTMTMRAKMLLTSGDIVYYDFRLAITSNRLESNARFRTSAGWLIGLMVYEDPAISKRGQTFVVVDIFDTKANVHAQHLISNYVAEPFHPSWPGTPLIASTEGPGFIRTIVGTDPAAGAEISETVPTNARWRLISVRVTLVTSATVTDRTPTITLDDGINIFGQSEDGVTVPASTTSNQTFSALGDIILLSEAYRIRSLTTNIQVGDNYGAPIYIVEEWIEV